MKPETPVVDKQAKQRALTNRFRTASRIFALFGISLMVAGFSSLVKAYAPDAFALAIGAGLLVIGILWFIVISREGNREN